MPLVLRIYLLAALVVAAVAIEPVLAQTPSGAYPVVSFSSLLGGNGEDEIDGIAVDLGGNVYLAGTTTSTDLPTTPGALQNSVSGHSDHVFIAKLNPTGTTILYLTYLDGSAADQATAIAVDGTGSAYVVGTTESQDFPITSGAARFRLEGVGCQSMDAGIGWWHHMLPVSADAGCQIVGKPKVDSEKSCAIQKLREWRPESVREARPNGV